MNKLKPYMEFEVQIKRKTDVSILGKECRWSLRSKFRHKGGQ
jgi:hypothetical protein